MLDFTQIKIAIHYQMLTMVDDYPHLFKVDAGKNELWDTYLGSFRPEDNPMFRERTTHDCQCCKAFIRACGGMVAITENNELVTIWDVEVGGGYQVVVDAMATMVKSKAIRNVFFYFQKDAGIDYNHQQREGENVTTWHHFHYQLPDRYVKHDSGSDLADSLSNYDVLSRGIREISTEAINTVLGLIDAGSLYRGEEHKGSLQAFLDLKGQVPDQLVEKLVSGPLFEFFIWRKSAEVGQLSRFKNSVIGTLVCDLTVGVDLEDAVKMFESKVAPDNYKRTKALVTPAMIVKAKEKVDELGLIDALSRRYAIETDISVNNVLFADRSFCGERGIFERLSEKAATQNIGKLKNATEVTIDHFLSEIMPNATGIELMVENRLEHNMMSLIAPVNADGGSLFKWNSGFSWAYNGDVADSMKDRVKAAGGKVDGVLRFSIQWNDCGQNNIDFDAHCGEPNNNHIYFQNKGRHHESSGMLDVDIINPQGMVAVENITWTNLRKMGDGEYVLWVNNYDSNRSTAGFLAEVEFEGIVNSFIYDKCLSGKECVAVATVLKTGSVFTLSKSLGHTEQRKDVWDITSQTYCRVSLILNSPNHWDGEKSGNKHLFFILKGCNSGAEARGFYNEFLRTDLIENRKTFELLGSEMKVAKSSEQLSGLGFSLTQRNHVFCKVTGDSTRIFKIKF